MNTRTAIKWTENWTETRTKAEKIWSLCQTWNRTNPNHFSWKLNPKSETYGFGLPSLPKMANFWNYSARSESRRGSKTCINFKIAKFAISDVPKVQPNSWIVSRSSPARDGLSNTYVRWRRTQKKNLVGVGTASQNITRQFVKAE